MKRPFRILFSIFAILVIAVATIVFLFVNQIHCDNILDITEKDSCFKDKAIEQRNPGLCKNIQLEELQKDFPQPTIRDSCFTEVAVLLENWSICSNITEWSLKGFGYTGKLNCELKVYEAVYSKALSEKNTEFCIKLEDEVYISKCLFDLAEELMDISICNKVLEYCKNLNNTDPCKIRVALAMNEISICNQLENDFRKDGCFRDFAMLNNDSEICNNIASENIRTYCLNII